VLREEEFAVVDWSPREGVSRPDAGISVSFSQEPDERSVESAFSLTVDEERVSGRFIWNGKTVCFSPSFPINYGKDFKLVVSAGAKNTQGLSLEEEFENKWTFQKIKPRPEIVETFPKDGAVIMETDAVLSICFSESVDIVSCKENININPDISGYWELTENNTLASFIPVELWQYGIEYKINISKDLESIYGVPLKDEYNFYFSFGDDVKIPDISGVFAVDENNNKNFELNRYFPSNVNLTDSIFENCLWEKTYSLLVEFTEKIDVMQIKNRITIEPSIKYAVEPFSGFSDSIKIRFLEIPVFEERYIISVKNGLFDMYGNKNENVFIYRIYANGETSKPPVFAGFRMPGKPSSDKNADSALVYRLNENQKDDFLLSYPYDFKIEGSDDSYKYETDIETWIELYFDTAKNSKIDILSLRELFRIEYTNNCMNFSAYKMTDSEFTWQEKEKTFSDYSRVEVRGKFQNINKNGMVTFYIGSGLKDDLGNKNTAIQRIELFK
jgi:hypothetical protein